MNRDDCVICRRGMDPNNWRIVFSDENWIVAHSDETNIAGYLVIEPRRHFLDMSEATVGEAQSYGQILSCSMKAIRDVVDCQRIYTFSLGESCPHYHLHLIPRKADFPRAYRARGIMQYPLSPVLDESITSVTCQRLRRAFSRVQALT